MAASTDDPWEDQAARSWLEAEQDFPSYIPEMPTVADRETTWQQPMFGYPTMGLTSPGFAIPQG